MGRGNAPEMLSVPAACLSCCHSAAPDWSPADPSSPADPPECPPSELDPLLHTAALLLHPAGHDTGSPPWSSLSAVCGDPKGKS